MKIFNVLVGVLRYCEKRTIQADSCAFKRAFEKLQASYPDMFDTSDLHLENELDLLVLDGWVAISGVRLQNLFIDDILCNRFDQQILPNLSQKEIKNLQLMSKSFPKLLSKNESVRYKKLTISC